MAAEAVFNPPFAEAVGELISSFETHKPPEIILDLTIAVLQKPVKLCCWVGDYSPAVGASGIAAGFYASDLFVKLLRAVRALDWKVVIVLLEQALIPPLEVASSVVDRP